MLTNTTTTTARMKMRTKLLSQITLCWGAWQCDNPRRDSELVYGWVLSFLLQNCRTRNFVKSAKMKCRCLSRTIPLGRMWMRMRMRISWNNPMYCDWSDTCYQRTGVKRKERDKFLHIYTLYLTRLRCVLRYVTLNVNVIHSKLKWRWDR